MTTREKRLAELDEQRRCLDELTEDDIGCEVWVKDYLSSDWMGPFPFSGYSGSTDYPFAVSNRSNFYRYTTKTPPVESQKITLRRWDGRKCPLPDDAIVLVRYRDGTRLINNVETIPSEHWLFGGGGVSSSDDITHYAPIEEIEVEE